MTAAEQEGSFKGRHFTPEVILRALRWDPAFPISSRDLSAMLSDRDVAVHHTTLYRWVQAYAAKLEQRVRRHLHLCTGSWRVDETYVKVKGVWTHPYRAVDSLVQTIDFLLSARLSRCRKRPEKDFVAGSGRLALGSGWGRRGIVNLTVHGRVWAGGGDHGAVMLRFGCTSPLSRS